MKPRATPSMSSRRPRSLKQTLFAIAVFGAVPLAVACGEKKPVIVDAGLVATTPAAVDAMVILDEVDAAAPDAADAAPPKKPGVAVNKNVARLKQCCGQLRIQAKALGVSPEAGMFLAAAAQCDGLAAQAGGSGTAPELGALKGALAGRNVPPVCAGF